MDLRIPERKKVRVIVDADAKNEADDQYAIVHAALTPSFEIRGFVPAHFGEQKSRQSLKDSHDEIILLFELMGMEGRFAIRDGAPRALPDESSPIDSPGARLIIAEAMSDDPRPLHVAFLGPLTDMASALLLEPRIAESKLRVIWIGGGDWPSGGREYNLGNDLNAANVVLRSSLELWQIPRNVYRMMPVSSAELLERVYPLGEIGKYLVEQLIEFNNESAERPSEFRVLGDSPAVGVIMWPDCGRWAWRPAPTVDESLRYVHAGGHRPIRVYEDIDSRFILEDLYAKLARFARGSQEPAASEEST